MLVEHKVELRRLVLFSLVGGLNTAVCFALFAALIDLCAWHHHLALVADYTFGIALGYVLHRASTFADRRHVRQALGKYLVIALVTFLVNFALLDALVRLELLEPLAAQAVALALVTMASYLAQKHWVFRSHAQLETGRTTIADQTRLAAPPAIWDQPSVVNPRAQATRPARRAAA